jgi:hypothetical protein
MNDSKAPKIVIGVGLAAIYAAGVFIFMPRGTHATAVAQNAPDVTTAQTAAEFIPPPAIDPAPADALTSVAEVPVAATAPTEQVVTTAARAKAKTIVSKATAPATLASNAGNAGPAREDTSTGNEPATSAGEEAPSAQAVSEPPDSDSQIATEPAPQVADSRDISAPASTTNN